MVGISSFFPGHTLNRSFHHRDKASTALTKKSWSQLPTDVIGLIYDFLDSSQHSDQYGRDFFIKTRLLKNISHDQKDILEEFLKSISNQNDVSFQWEKIILIIDKQISSQDRQTPQAITTHFYTKYDLILKPCHQFIDDKEIFEKKIFSNQEKKQIEKKIRHMSLLRCLSSENTHPDYVITIGSTIIFIVILFFIIKDREKIHRPKYDSDHMYYIFLIALETFIVLLDLGLILFSFHQNKRMVEAKSQMFIFQGVHSFFLDLSYFGFTEQQNKILHAAAYDLLKNSSDQKRKEVNSFLSHFFQTQRNPLENI